jgi:hypothetical protein
LPKIVFANALAKKQGFSLIALNVLHTGLSSATAYIPLLKSAALAANRTMISREGDWLVELKRI